MKLKDLHTNLNEEINLLEFYPKKEISVDSFGIDKKIIQDISKNKLKNTVKVKKNNKIIIKKITKNNTSDIIKKSFFQKKDINLNSDKKIKFAEQIKNLKNSIINKNKFQKKDFTKNANNIKNINFGFKNIFNNFNLFGNKITKYLAILFIIVFIVFADKAAIEYLTSSGYNKLISIKNSQNLENIESNINSANIRFKIAEILFIPFKIIPGEKIDNANYAIIGGIKTTDLLSKLTQYTKNTINFINKKGIENIAFSQLLENSKNIFNYSEKELTNIINIYKKINFSNDIKKQEKIDNFIEQGNKINYYISTINNNFDTFLNILGHNKRKKYLIVFQNNDEIRPQGGFMGSMGLIEIFRGQIKKFEKRDVYDFEFKIKKEHFKREIAPEGINKITNYLGLRDSNYFINDKDSSEKIKFFVQKSGKDIDGIIFINQNTLFKILDLIGEYNSDILNTKINSSNFSVIMSSLVEAKKYHIGSLGTPKKVLFDFIDEIKNKLKNVSKIELLKIIYKDIQNREIKFYNFSKQERELLEELNLYNPIKYNETLDFNYPVFTSISGNKSDRYIKTSYKKTVEKTGKCGYKTSFEIILEHTFDKKELEKNNEIFNKFKIKNNIKKLEEIQGNGTNYQYVRVIIPKNAKIEKNQNIISIKNYNKRGKVIAFFEKTPVGKKSNFKFSYILENKNCNLYNYKIYKQPGIKKYNLEYNSFGNKNIFQNLKSDLFIN